MVHLPMTKQGRLYFVTGTVLRVMRVTETLGDTLVMPVSVEDHASGAVDDVTGTRVMTGRLDDETMNIPQATLTMMTTIPQVLLREARLTKQPHLVEKRLHSLTHMPHKDWCDICVKARG